VIPEAAVGAQEPELLKMHCVSIADSQPDEPTLRRLYELSQTVESLHGCLAVFPREHVRA
jgi:hypothetical protein